MTKISVQPVITADGIMYTSLDDEIILQARDRSFGAIREAVYQETGIDTFELPHHFYSGKDGQQTVHEFSLTFKQFSKKYRRFHELDFDFTVPIHFTTIEDHDFKVQFDLLLKVTVLNQ